ncbi:MAG TPA: hypothetical protein VIY08_00360 [Candidatus Nitrosocosmicus sp.]
MVAMGPKEKEILFFRISKERTMFIAERYLSGLYKNMEFILFQQTETLCIYKQCKLLDLNHHIHPKFEKSDRKNNAIYQG